MTELLRVEHLRKVFPVRSADRHIDEFVAVDDVSFAVPRSGSLAIVGESGSGNMYVQQSSMSGVLRVWSVGGCPFTPYASGDASSPDFGVDISGVGINQYNSQSCQ